MAGRCGEAQIALRKSMLLLSHFSRVRLCATPWTAAHQAPLPMGFLQARVLEWGAVAFSIVGYIERKFMTKVTVLSIHEMNVVYSQGK